MPRNTTPARYGPFGRALYTARRAHTLTQEQLAELVDHSQTGVAAWEAGRAAPDPALVFKLETVLHVPAGHLSQHLGYAPLDASVAPSVESAVLADPLLDDFDRDAVLGLYRSLAARPKGD